MLSYLLRICYLIYHFFRANENSYGVVGQDSEDVYFARYHLSCQTWN